MAGKRRFIIGLVTLARLLAAFYIFIAPLPGMILTIVFDFFDGRIFAFTGAMDREQYHRWDKVLDMAGYVVELIVVLRYGVWWPFTILFLWRLVGYIAFVIVGKSWVFLLAPNIFEAAVLWVFLFYPSQPWNWLWVFIVAKYIQEWSLHWFVPHGGNRWWDGYMRKLLPKKSPLLRWTLSLSQSK
jgi:hypothetical protein